MHNDPRNKATAKQKGKIQATKLFSSIEEVAKGWDDMAFFDAFLAFFVLLIGDWTKFYSKERPDVPHAPKHLAIEETTQQQTPNTNTNTNKNTNEREHSLSNSQYNGLFFFFMFFFCVYVHITASNYESSKNNKTI